MSRFEVIRPRKPSLLERLGEAVRSYTLGPLSLNDPEIRKYFSGGETSTGVPVSEYSALTYSAVWAAVNLIAGDVASLPLVLYKRDGQGKERYESHPLYRLLHDSPNPEMSSITFRQTLQGHVLTWGNGYAEIERYADGTNRPRYLWPITPERVTPFRDEETLQLKYRVKNEKSNKDVIVSPSDMIHVPGLGWDGIQGYSPVAKARESLGIGMAAERFAGTFYGNGSTFGGVITHPTRFATPLARENFEKSLRNRHKGVERAHGLLLLDEGMTYAQVGIPPNEAQFLESRQFQITEIARWFNVPPHKIGDLSRATFSNIEQQNIEYLQTTLIHWLEAWEQELMRKLISPLERNQQFIEHVVEGLLRGDSAGRAALEAAEFQIGALSPNEARGLANRNPVSGGDRPFVPLNMIPLDRIDEYIDSLIEKAKPAPAPAAPAAQEASAADRALLLRIEELTAANTEKELAARQAIQRAEDCSAAMDAAFAARDAYQAELAHALEGKSGLETSLAAEQSEREREQQDAAVALSAAINERDVARNERDAHLEQVEINERRWREAVAAEQVAREEVGAITAERNTLAEELDAELALTQARGQRVLDAEELQKAAVSAKCQAEADREAAVQLADTAWRDKAIAEQAQQAANEMIATLQGELQQTRENHAARVAGVLVAHRGLIVDVMQRMVEREIDRAKRHQATPQKFRAWIDAFYTTHGDVMTEALLPVVRAHLSVLSSKCDPHEMARQLAEDHVAESAKQLRDLLHVEDFAPMLERTLAQWETSRPEAMADRVLTKGLADVR